MAKKSAISVRVTDELKKAVERAADEDDRSVAAYVERVLAKHLADTGHLPK